MAELIISEKTPVVKSLLKWQEKRVTKTTVAKKMYKAGYERRGINMLKCGDSMAIEYCKICGSHKIRSTNLCRDKICPVCRWRLALKRYAQMISVCDVLREEYPNAKYCFLTLTIKNCKVQELGETLKRMAKAWNRILQRKIAKENIQGWARSVEITYNRHTGEMHPHYHVIIMLNNGRDIIANDIATAWKKALDLNYTPIIDIRDIKQGKETDIGGAVCETFKYSIKDNDLNDMPISIFAQFVAQVNGMRATAFGGEIRKIRAELGLTDKDMEMVKSSEETTINCPKCGADMQTAIFSWANFEESIRENGLRKILELVQKSNKNEVKNA